MLTWYCLAFLADGRRVRWVINPFIGQYQSVVDVILQPQGRQHVFRAADRLGSQLDKKVVRLPAGTFRMGTDGHAVETA